MTDDFTVLSGGCSCTWRRGISEGQERVRMAPCDASLMDAYLDIETTGLSFKDAGTTVIDIYLVNGIDDRLVQLVGMDVTAVNLLESLPDVSRIYTYNGSRFDLPFIHGSLDVNLAALCSYHDLTFDCWQRNLYGGFKAVEQQLGIPRTLQGVSGWDAVRLWWQYLDYGECVALATLLKYNREDAMNLKVLRERLEPLSSITQFRG